MIDTVNMLRWPEPNPARTNPPTHGPICGCHQCRNVWLTYILFAHTKEDAINGYAEVILHVSDLNMAS